MTKLIIRLRSRELSPEEAVEMATTPDSYIEGVVERQRATIELQNKVLANMLKVQFGIYHEDFSDPEHYPQTDADKLAFIISTGSHTPVVFEED